MNSSFRGQCYTGSGCELFNCSKTQSNKKVKNFCQVDISVGLSCFKLNNKKSFQITKKGKNSKKVKTFLLRKKWKKSIELILFYRKIPFN